MIAQLHPVDAIWNQTCWPTSFQVMFWCSQAASYYLNQIWLFVNGLLSMKFAVIAFTFKVKFNLKSHDCILPCFTPSTLALGKTHNSHHYLDCFMLPSVSQSPSSACIHIPRLLHGHDCMYTDLGSLEYFSIWHYSCLCMFCQSSLEVNKRAYMLCFMPLPLCSGGIMFSCCVSVRLSIRPSIFLSIQSLKYPLSTYTWVCWFIRPIVTISRPVPPFVYLSVFPERFWTFPGEHMKGMAWNCAFWCILTTFRIDHSLLNFPILVLFWLWKRSNLGFQAFPGDLMEEMAWKIAGWCMLTSFRLWSWSVDFHVLQNAWKERLKFCMEIYSDHCQN